MQIEVFTMCNSAQIYEGKMMILGTCNQLAIEKMPTKCQQLMLAIRFACDPSEEAKKIPCSINVFDPNNKPMVQPISLDLGEPNVEAGMTSYNFCIDCSGLLFVEYGLYTICVKVGKEEYTYRFNITKPIKQ